MRAKGYSSNTGSTGSAIIQLVLRVNMLVILVMYIAGNRDNPSNQSNAGNQGNTRNAGYTGNGGSTGVSGNPKYIFHVLQDCERTVGIY